MPRIFKLKPGHPVGVYRRGGQEFTTGASIEFEDDQDVSVFEGDAWIDEVDGDGRPLKKLEERVEDEELVEYKPVSRMNKSELLEACANKGLDADDSYTVEELRTLLREE